MPEKRLSLPTLSPSETIARSLNASLEIHDRKLTPKDQEKLLELVQIKLEKLLDTNPTLKKLCYDKLKESAISIIEAAEKKRTEEEQKYNKRGGLPAHVARYEKIRLERQQAIEDRKNKKEQEERRLKIRRESRLSLMDDKERDRQQFEQFKRKNSKMIQSFTAFNL